MSYELYVKNLKRYEKYKSTSNKDFDRTMSSIFNGSKITSALKENIESEISQKKVSKNPETWWFSFKSILDNNFNINSGVAPLNKLRRQPEVIDK